MPILLCCALALAGPSPSMAQASVFQPPLEHYPLNDPCLGWGGLNRRYPRCGAPGKHLADDACAPNETPVLAVADGVVKLALEVEDCSVLNWGWVVVAEHVLLDGTRVCSIYGHCRPLDGIGAGSPIVRGETIAFIENICIPHIHFGIYLAPFGPSNGQNPAWLTGYLPSGTACPGDPVSWPGNYVDPVQFVQAHLPVEPLTWTLMKNLYR